MRPLSFAAVAVPFVLILSAVAPSSAAGRKASSPEPMPARGAEVHRLQVRLDSVLAELSARDLSGLTGIQRARRGALVETLRAYRDGGEFPHNYDFPGEAVPYFVDRETGVICAVGHLLASSGRRDIVDRVAAMNNNVWVRELAGDTAFVSWLDSHGLTVAEAARIQAPYVGDPAPPPGPGNGSQSSARVAGVSVALGSALVASYWNARPNAASGGAVANALGMIVGATAVGVGASSIGDGGAPSGIGAASMVAGAASAWLSARNVVRSRRIAEQKRETARASVAPMLPIDGSSGAGIAVTLRF